MQFKPLDLVEYIVISNSATPPDVDIGRKEVDLQYRQQGRLSIGHHLIIRRDGTLEFGRPLDRRGDHCKKVNHKSISVHLIGDGDPLPAQLDTLRFSLLALQEKYPKAMPVGLSELDARTANPGFRLEAFGLK